LSNDLKPARRIAITVAVPVMAAALTLYGAGNALATPVNFGPVVGLPGATSADGQAQAGRLDVHLTGGGSQLLDEVGLGLVQPGSNGLARFGSVIVIRDLNHDGLDDVLVGAPGAGPDLPGRVELLFGSSAGITPAGAITLSAPALAGDRFGAALAVNARNIDSDTTDLWIGAPGHDVNGKVDAGAIFRYTLNAAGVPTYHETITQDSPLVPGTAKTGDHFGAVMAENSPFNDIVVGVPGEDIGKLKDAGAVQTLGVVKGCTLLCPGKVFTQDSHNIPGKVEAGDRFGAALAQGIYRRKTYRCSQYASVAIGSPGEDIASIKDAGSVTTFMLNREYGKDDDARGCPPIMLSQGSGLPGTSEAGDQLGATLSTVPGDQFDDVNQRDAMMIGVPGEDIRAIKDAGRVLVGTGSLARSYGPQAGDLAGQRFGSVLSGYQAIILNI
jgi:hypothetical protein